jgi:hypothetical protein
VEVQVVLLDRAILEQQTPVVVAVVEEGKVEIHLLAVLVVPVLLSSAI